VLFGLVHDESHAREVAARMKEPRLWVRVSRTIAETAASAADDDTGVDPA
jgi:hypothetical protein